MRTLFLGSYGFGNLGDELCLLDALRQFPTADPWAFSDDFEYSARTTGLKNFVRTRKEAAALKPARIVLGGGGVGFWPSLRDALHWMADGLNQGAELHIHNIGVAELTQPEWHADPTVRRVLEALKSFTVRDHVSRWLVRDWGFGNDPGLTYYPERTLPPEPFDGPVFPADAVGVSITGQKIMLERMEQNRDRIHALLRQLGPRTFVPVVSTYQAANPQENDMLGFEAFERLFLKPHQVVAREFLDPLWWRSNLTPLRLKHVISKVSMLVSQRKHNIIHAIGCGTPFAAVFPTGDDSLPRLIYSLGRELPADVRIVALP